ncbi:hypothetical protein A3739_11405 [Oleiphilus sp. HI0067]|nr:hypothetical protein A3738_08615 [Oleiphilus sp. HI0066]KZY67996.1 hypothetical protein A3739_11405 [Oleiphilus sp. HI0067]
MLQDATMQTHYDYLVTGGTGLIGSTFIKSLPAGITVLVLTRQKHPKRLDKVTANLKLISNLNDISDDTIIDHVINLAGEPIVDRPWTESRKQVLRSSRIGVTEQLADLSARLAKPFKTLVSGSAIGYYGSDNGTQCSETSPRGSDFAASLCSGWEQAATTIRSERRTVLRISIVLSGDGGMLAKLYPSFILGAGSVIGDGKQMMSWIHISDLVELIHQAINDQSMEGAFNAVAPINTTNQEFSRVLAQNLRRPLLLKMPTIVTKWIFGQRSDLLLGNQDVVSDKLQALSYSFKYPEIHDALSQIYKHKR